MLDEPFRTRLEPVVDPLARGLARMGVTPNQITVAACILALMAAGTVASGRARVGVFVWLMSRVGDGLDGALARVANKRTPLGGFLDITLDMLAYVAMVLAFAWCHPDLGLAWAAVLAGYVLVITTTLALSDAAGAAGRSVSATNRTFQFTPGIAEAGETNMMYIAWAMWPEQVWWLVWVWVVALVATAVQRIVLAWRELHQA
jgi:phosphatidylglycerophosphate synthase